MLTKFCRYSPEKIVSKRWLTSIVLEWLDSMSRNCFCSYLKAKQYSEAEFEQTDVSLENEVLLAIVALAFSVHNAEESARSLLHPTKKLSNEPIVTNFFQG
jgi:hypothetical protein